MVGTTLREDVSAARNRMSLWDATPGGLRDFRKLETLLRDGETVTRVLRAAHGRTRGGLLVRTDKRLLFVRAGWTGHTMTKNFWLERISSMSWASGVLSGRVIIFSIDDTSAEFAEVDKGAGQVMVIEARKALGFRDDSRPTGTRDPYDRLHQLAELHADGVLSDEEFQAKKTDMLARM